jgi:purine-nucleoside phosphorylase
VITETVAFLHERITRRPRVLLVLGSGLGSIADELDDAVRIPFADIPGFAPATVEGHRGVVVAGTLEGTECVALQGRYHLYEGHPPEALTLPVRALAAIGARTLIVTNAAGGLNRSFRVGDLMLIDDHINLMWQNPLIGTHVPGDARFPDMSQPYDLELRAIAHTVARQLGVTLVSGTYCANSGPSYETPAEIRMFQRLGADAVGMSTVPEVLVARALGVRVLGVSLITNQASGMSGEPLNHEEVIAAGSEARGRFSALLRGIVREVGTQTDLEVA